MITPSFSITATERVLPKLALDFTTASLDSRVTFTRALNTATRVNSSGYIETVNADLPRFDYDPITLTCKGLLIEEARTNLLTYSEQFDNAAWTKTNATVTADAVAAPDGTLSADKVVETAVTGGHSVKRVLTIVSGATYTASVFVKAAERTLAEVWFANNGATRGAGIRVNLSTGAYVSQRAVAGAVLSSYSITKCKDGWYRIAVTVSMADTGGGLHVFPIATGTATNTISYAGDGVSGIYSWGGQLEAGNGVTSYIPTTTTSLTRNADVATMTGTNFSSWWTATTGSATVSVIPKTISDVRPILRFDNNTADNIISLRGNSANLELYIRATTDQVQIDAGTIVADTAYKLSGAWNTNNCAAAQNGASPIDDTSATIPTVTQARIGSDGTNYANAWIQKLSYWPQRLINAEVQAFSK